MSRPHLTIPAVGLVLACTSCGLGTQEDPVEAFFGVWNMSVRHDPSGSPTALDMPRLFERDEAGQRYCSGQFYNLEVLQSGVAFLSPGEVYGYGAQCEGQLTYTQRVPYTWVELPDEGGIGFYYDHFDGGDESGSGGIPTQELVVVCTIGEDRMRCADPELGIEGGGSDFARPVCSSGDHAACGPGKRCFAGQCVVPIGQ